jgi:hypothetical protein
VEQLTELAKAKLAAESATATIHGFQEQLRFVEEGRRLLGEEFVRVLEENHRLRKRLKECQDGH